MIQRVGALTGASHPLESTAKECLLAATLQCTLVTPQEQLLDESVTYARIPAWDGLVGIAASRAPLLVKLGDGDLRLDLPGGQSRHFFIGGGFAQMKDNRLCVLADEALPANAVTAADAEKRLQAALEMPAGNESQRAAREKAVHRAKALVTMSRGV
jgi:F-type H+-transporting ATPase subunit epsilon